MSQLINKTTVETPSSTFPFQGLQTSLPGGLRVIRRDGTLAPFERNRICIAIKKAFLAVEGGTPSNSHRIEDTVTGLADKIIHSLEHRSPGGTVHIETIQDLVELSLMRAGEHQVARAYVLYREARHQARQKNQKTLPTFHVRLEDHQEVPLNLASLSKLVEKACHDLPNVAADKIIEEVMNNLFDGITIKEIYKAMVISARTLVETEPNYSYVTARLLLNGLYEEAMTALGIQHNLSQEHIDAYYQTSFKQFIQKGIETELLSPTLKRFDLDKLSQALLPIRDQQFTYLSLQTLYDRYFLHLKGIRIELPQVFFMRVAMGLSDSEGEKRNEKAIEFYRLLSSFDYMSSTPTLFNAGTRRPQLSSCYLSTVPDDLSGIYNAIRDNALLSKYAGGLGNDWTPVRAMGAHIKGTNGKSLGIVPFLNVVDATAVAVNQGGKRKGAVCAYLETWHMDIEEFLELRKNTGDERRRTHDMNTAHWIPDLFMKRLFSDQAWTLFSPNDVPELHDLYGQDFEKAYANYEKKAEQGLIQSRTLSAKTLWRKMLSLLFETGHPWITFKDPCNLRSPQQHVGTVHSSNLCTEITLNTSEDEIAVCNLGSINIANHIKNEQLDTEKLRKTINTAIRMLDNVIDINYYSVPQAKQSNQRHRPIGLGIMGFQDALYQQRIPYASDQAIEFADRCMEYISYYAIEASSTLAQERGVYPSYSGSLWHQGILPIDSIQQLAASRGSHFQQNTEQTLDWSHLRKEVQTVGMRNSNIMAIAPTATIANICGVTPSTEPTYQNLFVKSNLSGEFTVVNPYMVRDLKKLNLWDSVMIHDLKHYNGSLKHIERIPQTLKTLYATAFEIQPQWLVKAASRRQKWLDQAHSLNLYVAEPSGKKLDELYRTAWEMGLKTTYYLRTLGATHTEKATITDRQLNAVSSKYGPSDEPSCEACE